MDFTQLLETSVVTGGMGTVLFYLNSKAQTDSDIAVLGMIHYVLWSTSVLFFIPLPYVSFIMYILCNKDHDIWS